MPQNVKNVYQKKKYSLWLLYCIGQNQVVQLFASLPARQLQQYKVKLAITREQRFILQIYNSKNMARSLYRNVTFIAALQLLSSNSWDYTDRHTHTHTHS